MAQFLTGLLGGFSVGELLERGYRTLHRFGRIGLEVGVRIFSVMARPEVGIPFSIAVVKLSELLTIDLDSIIASLDNTANTLDTLNPDAIIPAIEINIETIVNEANANLPLNICGSPPNPLIDPAAALAWVGCNLANGFIFIARGLYIIGKLIALSLLWVLRQLAVYILIGLAKLGALMIRYVVKPIAFGVLSILLWFRDKIKWACCEYLRFSPFLVMFRIGSSIFRRGNIRLGRTLLASVGAAIFTFTAIHTLVPECSLASAPSLPPSPPAIGGFTAPSLYILRDFEPSYNVVEVRSALKIIIATDLQRVAEGSGLM